MGTSGSSSGSGSNTPLVPTWLDEPLSGPLPGGDEGPADNLDGEDGGAEPPAGAGDDQTARPPIEAAPYPARFQSGRRNFSTFAGSGGNDRGAMRRAVRDYVRNGTRGSGNAVRQMRSSRAAAGGMLGVLRGFQRDGIEPTLRRLNLDDLVGRLVEDVFLGLTDVVCQDGGSIDEAIARDAWLETIAELEGFGIEDLESLTTGQVREMLLAFVAHAIETKLFQEIGTNGFNLAADLQAIEAFEQQFRSYIRRSVRDSFASDLSGLPNLTDQQIRTIVDRTYRDAWDLLELWGDIEE